MSLNWLLVFLPIAIGLDWMEVSPVLVFLTSALAVVPLAGLMGDATEALAEYLGPTLGGLLNASLGNAPEIIIALFALHKGLIAMVKASLTGSIVGNLLFGLGLSAFAGGLRYRKQSFAPDVARMNGALLTLASFALLIPAIYRQSPVAEHPGGREISLEFSAILFLIYIASVAFTMVTRRPVVGEAGVKAAKEEAGAGPADTAEGAVGWSRNRALAILTAVTIGLAIMSEILTGALEPAAQKLHFNPLVAGIFLLALVGNAAEMLNAVRFARKDKMELAIGVTVGASTQVGLLVAPVLVIFGAFMGQDMNLLFSRYEIWAVVLSVYTTRNIIYDGETNWLEGLMLIALYFMLAVGFYYLPTGQ